MNGKTFLDKLSDGVIMLGGRGGLDAMGSVEVAAANGGVVVSDGDLHTFIPLPAFQFAARKGEDK